MYQFYSLIFSWWTEIILTCLCLMGECHSKNLCDTENFTIYSVYNLITNKVVIIYIYEVTYNIT